MTLESILADVGGLAMVLGAILALGLVVRLILSLRAKRAEKAPAGNTGAGVTEEPAPAEPAAQPFGQGELNLTDVDEKTAALIMAIVSHESGIPLAELNFKSIRQM